MLGFLVAWVLLAVSVLWSKALAIVKTNLELALH
jgi:hypothetical protein